MANSPPTTDPIDGAPVRSDPIGDRYYKPLRRADAAGDWLFWIAAILSFAAVAMDKDAAPRIYGWINIIFIIAVAATFIIGIACRLYLTPRAEDNRRKDLIANSFDTSLTHESTTGYYNNAEKNPFRRIVVSVMESCFFTGRIAQLMLFRVRLLTAGYFLAFAICVLTRETDLGLIGAGAQAIFSEIVLSKWLRLEWLRHRSEQTYDAIGQLVRTGGSFNREHVRAQALELVARYETSKANAGVVLSNALFEKHNPPLTKEWDAIRSTLPR